jgi:hypothetical protein
MYVWLYSPCGPWPLFSFLIYTQFCKTPRTGYEPVARPLPTRRTIQTRNKCTQTYMPRVGFETTIPEFEQAKTVHALDRAATVIGVSWSTILNYFQCWMLWLESQLVTESMSKKITDLWNIYQHFNLLKHGDNYKPFLTSSIDRIYGFFVCF